MNDADSRTPRRSEETVQSRSLLEFKLVVEYFANCRRDVDLVHLQQRLWVNTGRALLQAIGCIVARLTPSAIMQKVLVQFGLTDSLVVVSFTEFINRQSVLRRIWLEHVRVMFRLCLRRDAHTLRTPAKGPP